MRAMTVLIVDDETSFIRSLTYALRGEGIEAKGAASGEEALAQVERERPDIVLLDLRMPGMGGMETLAALQAIDPGLPVIMISAHGDTRAAVQAVKSGAADYLSKPFELDELLHALTATLDRGRLRRELDYHRQRSHPPSGLLGESPAMAGLRATVRRIATSSAARVLLLGESGTGKALVARAIHADSPRSAGPFVEVNCAALPEQLIEAELFGAEKGAYTGAHQKREGLVSLADKGSVFLDEIGELPLALQAKFLHFLENGDYRPVGAGRQRTADVRVIAATNRDLVEDVADGRFREDLYYRLNVITVTLPPLRQRGADILVLAAHFADAQSREEGCAPIRFDRASEAMLIAHRWPGNVRELKNLIERLTILYPGQDITAEHLPPEFGGDLPTAGDTDQTSIESRLEATERHLVLDALHRSHGHKGRAAGLLGISRHALKRRLQRLGLGESGD